MRGTAVDFSNLAISSFGSQMKREASAASNPPSPSSYFTLVLGHLQLSRLFYFHCEFSTDFVHRFILLNLLVTLLSWTPAGAETSAIVTDKGFLVVNCSQEKASVNSKAALPEESAFSQD